MLTTIRLPLYLTPSACLPFSLWPFLWGGFHFLLTTIRLPSYSTTFTCLPFCLRPFLWVGFHFLLVTICLPLCLPPYAREDPQCVHTSCVSAHGAHYRRVIFLLYAQRRGKKGMFGPTFGKIIGRRDFRKVKRSCAIASCESLLFWSVAVFPQKAVFATKDGL